MKIKFEPDLTVLKMEIEGQRHVWAVPKSSLRGRSPDDLPMQEWRGYPWLSARALLDDFLVCRRGGEAA